MRRGSLHPVGAAVAVMAIATSVLLLTQPAEAHDYLVSSSPAYNSTVTRPITTVSLTFDAPVLNYGRSSTALLVTGPGQATRHFETSCPHIANDTLSTAVHLGMAGRYTVTWRIVSADGHPVSDSIHFTYRPPQGTPIGAGTPHGPACGEPTSNLSGSRFGAPGDTGSGAAAISPLLWITIIGATVLVLLAIGAILIVAVVLRRRAKSP